MSKPRVCIALPGIHYASHVPHVLVNQALIPHLGKVFDLTLVFRKNLETPNLECNYLTILEEKNFSSKEKKNHRSYYTPGNIAQALKYKWLLNRFAQRYAPEFDVILERKWSFVGAFSDSFNRYKIPTIISLEAEYYTNYVQGSLIKKSWNLILKIVLPYLRKKWLAKASAIIVETQQMTDFLIENGYISSDKSVYVIPMGVDPKIFFPQNREACRRSLGLDQTHLILTYVGSLNNSIQSLDALIESLGCFAKSGVVLHVVGEGTWRKELEAIAAKFHASVVFHGRVSQEKAALLIGSANLCVAPYNKKIYPDNKFTSASLKVAEYLACGRPILTIACERMEDLLVHGKCGFLVENEVYAYQDFFKNFPSLEHLEQMENFILSGLASGYFRENKMVLTWTDISHEIQQVIDRVLQNQKASTHYAA